MLLLVSLYISYEVLKKKKRDKIHVSLKLEKLEMIKVHIIIIIRKRKG